MDRPVLSPSFEITPLLGKVILITGAVKRIGEAIARRLHADGARVAIHTRHSVLAANRLAETLNAIRPKSAIVVTADLVEPNAAARVVAEVLSCYERLDGLVNNASSFFPTPIGSIDLDAWNDLVGSNFMAPLFLSQAAAPFLQKTKGAIVNITDIHAERPLRNYPLYCAAKGALLALTRSLAVELGPQVRVNAVAPGAILWPENKAFDRSERQAIVAHTLLEREGSPEDIARAVQFLFLNAPYITGQVINVDGGRTAHL